MAAPTTSNSYAEQLSSAFNALKFATPQQLAQVAQIAQANPQSPEALALASANNFQQNMRSGATQAPTQTVYQKQIQQLLSTMQPQQAPQAPQMQGGIAGVGPNVYAAQAAAAQDPMRNAGIGIAPENTQPMQHAASGGLVALAHGGEVPGYFRGGDMPVPETGSAAFPEEEEESDEDASYNEPEEQAENLKIAQNDVPLERTRTPKIIEPRQGDEEIHQPAPGSSAAAIKAKEAFHKSVQDVKDEYGPSFAMSPELEQKFQKQLDEAGRDKWINTMAQGIGSMLSAQTPFFGQALGQGLMAGAAGYQQGGKEESDLQKQMLQLRLAAEKEQHGDTRSAVGQVLNMNQAALKRQQDAQLAREKMRSQELGYRMAFGRAGAGNIMDSNEFGQRVDTIARQIQNTPEALQQRWTYDQIRQKAIEQATHEMQQFTQRNPNSAAAAGAMFGPLFGTVGGP